MPTAVLVSACVMLGLAVGTVCTVIVERVPHGDSLRDPVRCPHCETRLHWYEMLPLSWLALRGRCRHCDGRIGVRYPAIELATALVFGVVAWRLGWRLELPGYLYLAAVGVCLAVIDVVLHRLPDALTLPSYGVLGGWLALCAVLTGSWGALARAAVAMTALFCLYYLLAIVVPGGLGFGDVKLAGVLGLALGWAGWNAVITGTVLGFVLGGVVSLLLLLTRRVSRTSRVPFGPFMLAGAALVLLIGDPVASAAALG